MHPRRDGARKTRGAPARPPLPWSVSTASFGELLDNPATRDVLERHLPGVSANPRFSTARRMTLRALMIFAPDELAEDAIRAVESDLSRLPRP